MTTAERIRAYFAACTSGDADAIASHFTPDAVIYDTNHRPVVSAAEIGRFWDSIATKWAGARWHVDTLVADGDAAAIEWTMTGTHRGEPFAVRGSEHYALAGGLIAQIRQYWTFDPTRPGSELVDYPYGADDRFAPLADPTS